MNAEKTRNVASAGIDMFVTILTVALTGNYLFGYYLFGYDLRVPMIVCLAGATLSGLVLVTGLIRNSTKR